MIEFSYNADTGVGSFGQRLSHDRYSVSRLVEIKADFNTLNALSEMIRESTIDQVDESIDEFKRRVEWFMEKER